MVVQHLALVDALHRVQLVLHLSLEVGPGLLALPLVLEAVDHDEGHQDTDRDDAGEEGDHCCVGTGTLALGRGLMELIVLRVNLPAWQNLADRARVLREADASECVVPVLAESAVETRVGVTLIHLLTAVLARVPGRTRARKVIDTVSANAPVGTRGVLTVVVVVLAVLADEPVLTHALVVVDEGEADTVVVAGLLLAQIYHCLTIAALKARGTGAGIASHVAHASGPILTRIVFGADIKV